MSDIELMAEHQWITHWNSLSLKLSFSNIMHSLYPSNPNALDGACSASFQSQMHYEVAIYLLENVYFQKKKRLIINEGVKV